MGKPHLKKFSKPILGAAFLMATSAIGPGFLTQTATFTNSLLASFGFVIFISILLEIGAQLNIWRILSVSSLRAQELANTIIPGAGKLLTVLIVLGGLAFNAGNLAGAGLGLEVLSGISPKYGALISASVATILFFQKDSIRFIDLIAKVLGVLMIIVTLYVVIVAKPPFLEAGLRMFWPSKIDGIAILTLVGGTVGGYISFAGAHRILDAGLTGSGKIQEVSSSAVTAILLASLMRLLLFLAALGVVSKGISLGTHNPAAAVFMQAAGNLGYLFFGIVMWSAAITSVIGCAYTSISFIIPVTVGQEWKQKKLLLLFLTLSLTLFVVFDNPVQVLIGAGALNGIILPLSLSLILIGSTNKKLMGEYQHPKWLGWLGWGVVVATTFLGTTSLIQLVKKMLFIQF
ncbi:MAG: divalent metal cation transporter [Bacteroidetes bacterium]|nr:divalent metal cation transporter [Bacteroidota bacterium]